MIRFVLNGALQEIEDEAASTTVLDFLRDGAGLTGTKEGCGEGDCGACTVVRLRDGRFEAVNSCLMQLGQADGSEIVTAEGLVQANGGTPVPAQDAMASGDGTQCGFCTPGFICAMFALSQSGEQVTDETIHDALAGNLCRCTGYRPIIEAARKACGSPVAYRPAQAPARDGNHAVGDQAFHAPSTLSGLLDLRRKYPDAMLLAGGTDLGIPVSKDRVKPAVVLHTANVGELREIAESDTELMLGAAVTYTEALPYIDRLFPSFAELIRRIGSRQIRNLGTIGGNIGNASPIGDTPPSLIALGATLVLASEGGEREMPLEDFFLDYRKTDLRPDEVIRAVRIPKLSSDEAFRVYKVSKRYDQDISAVVGAFRLGLAGGKVERARIAFGGMAATPKRAVASEAFLQGGDWSEDAMNSAGKKISGEFAPIDDHRATAAYRLKVAANLFLRLYRDVAETEPDLEVVKI